MIKPYSKKVEKPWGYELILTSTDSPVTGKILHLNAGKRFSYQYHDQKDEILTLVKGEAKITINDQVLPMAPNFGYHINPMMKHRVEAVTDIDIFEVSTPEKGTTFRLEDDYHRSDETEAVRLQTR
jgi:mannose-6-phosphate isomerase-like protein (cupin superfamily)